MKRQRSLFEFGLTKVIEHNGAQEQVVPRRILNYEADNPLSCKHGCGARFSRPCARATHERTCKRKLRPEPQPEPAWVDQSGDVIMAAEESLAAIPPLAQQGQLPDSLELHRHRVGQQGAVAVPAKKALGIKKRRGLGKGSARRKRYTTEEKLSVS